MDAGTEINARIAGFIGEDVRADGLVRVVGGVRQHRFPAPDLISDGWRLPLPYSTDIAAAWGVVGKLHGDAEAWARFDQALRDEVLPAFHATALHELEVSVAALAICRAALSVPPTPQEREP